MKKPLVTVVIPLYQTEKYIRESLASVLAQSFDDFEVLVVDDGSTDAGPAIARGICDHRVRIISQTNRGLAGARNTGIRESRGRYIAFLDADDLWCPQKLARHVALLDARPDVGLSYSASRLIDDDGNPLDFAQWPCRASTRPQDVMTRNPVGNGSAPVMRRTALEQIAFWDVALQRVCWFDESFRQSEDIECWTRLAATTSWQLALIPHELTQYRITTGGLSANTSRQLETWRRFRSKVKSYAPSLEATQGDLAEAFQLRYLARRCITSLDGRGALRLMHTAITLSPRILAAEPLRCATTYIAALLLSAFPPGFAERVMRRIIRPMTTAPRAAA